MVEIGDVVLTDWDYSGFYKSNNWFKYFRGIQCYLQK
jgi:hypothetical protein